MGRAIDNENRIDMLETLLSKLDDRVDLLERAMHAGMKKTSKKSKKLVDVIKEAENE
jgi:hypothetical protein